MHGITCPGTNTYDAGGHQVGAVSCSSSNLDADGAPSVDRYVHMVWSSKPTKVVAFAVSPIDDTRAVMDWWGKRGGPIVD